MRTPDNTTTETFMRPDSQIARMLAMKQHLGTPTSQATSKQRQAGRNKRGKAKPTPETAAGPKGTTPAGRTKADGDGKNIYAGGHGSDTYAGSQTRSAYAHILNRA